MEPWYESWFASEEYLTVYRHRDTEEAEQAIDLLEKTLSPAPGDHILDLACGAGRHAIALAKRGYRVTGSDLSETLLAKARENARRENVDVRFVREDMRHLTAVEVYDGAASLFTSFGYFETDEENEEVISSVARALKPGGWLFFDFLNAPYLRATLEPKTEDVRENITILQDRKIENNRIVKMITLVRNGQKELHSESVRLFTKDELEQMFRRNNLHTLNAFDSYDGKHWTESSPRLILIAKKR